MKTKANLYCDVMCACYTVIFHLLIYLKYQHYLNCSWLLTFHFSLWYGTSVQKVDQNFTFIISHSSSFVLCSISLFLSTNHQYIHFLMRLIIGRMFRIAFFVFQENSFAVVLCSLVFVRGNEEDILA